MKLPGLDVKVDHEESRDTGRHIDWRGDLNSQGFPPLYPGIHGRWTEQKSGERIYQ